MLDSARQTIPTIRAREAAKEQEVIVSILDSPCSMAPASCPHIRASVLMEVEEKSFPSLEFGGAVSAGLFQIKLLSFSGILEWLFNGYMRNLFFISNMRAKDRIREFNSSHEHDWRIMPRLLCGWPSRTNTSPCRNRATKNQKQYFVHD